MILERAKEFSNIVEKSSDLERSLAEGKNIVLFADGNSDVCRRVVEEYAGIDNSSFLMKPLRDFLSGYQIKMSYVDIASLDEEQRRDVTTVRKLLVGSRIPLELPIIRMYKDGEPVDKKPLTGYTSTRDLVDKVVHNYGLVRSERIE